MTSKEKLEAIRKYVHEYNPSLPASVSFSEEAEEFVSGDAYDWMYKYIVELQAKLEKVEKELRLINRAVGLD